MTNVDVGDRRTFIRQAASLSAEWRRRSEWRALLPICHAAHESHLHNWLILFVNKLIRAPNFAYRTSCEHLNIFSVNNFVVTA